MALDARVTVRTTITPRKTARTAAGRRARDLRRSIGQEIRSQRLDAGISQRALARAAGVDAGFLSQIESGDREPSLSVLSALADALGGDLRVRLYPGTGPRLRDGIQARIIEALLAIVHPRWKRHVEVPVHRPVRGVIDVVLRDPGVVVVAAEVHSQIARLEQQVRWAGLKAEALQSAAAAEAFTTETIDRMLVLRTTEATRALAERFHETLTSAYPASSTQCLDALTTVGAPWPGAAVLWAQVDGDEARILDRPPRGLRLGR